MHPNFSQTHYTLLTPCWVGAFEVLLDQWSKLGLGAGSKTQVWMAGQQKELTENQGMQVSGVFWKATSYGKRVKENYMQILKPVFKLLYTYIWIEKNINIHTHLSIYLSWVIQEEAYSRYCKKKNNGPFLKLFRQIWL